MSKNRTFFKDYAALTKKQISDIFSGKLPVYSSFEVFLGKVFPEFLEDFMHYEKSIVKILKKEKRRPKFKLFPKNILRR